MARPPGVRWIENTRAWRSDVGPPGRNGRNTPVYFREDGRGKLGPRDRPRAMALLAAYLIDRERATYRAAAMVADPTVTELVQMYLQDRERSTGAKNLRSLVPRLRRWTEHVGPDGLAIGDRPARSIEASDLQRLIATWTRAGRSVNYVGNVARTVKACWRWAASPVLDRVPTVLLDHDPLSLVRAPAARRARVRYCPPGPSEAFLRWCESRVADEPGDTGRMLRRAALMLRFIRETGCRPDEACRLNWSHLSDDRRTFVIREHKTAQKTGRDRVIPMPESLAKRIVQAAAEPDNHPVFVFTHRRTRGQAQARGTDRRHGCPWTTGSIGHRFAKWRNEARIPGLPPDATLYDFRRSWFADAYEAGVSAELAGGAGGTSARMVDAIYASHRPRTMIETTEAVARLRTTSQAPDDDG